MVWSESNVQDEITLIWILLKSPLSWDSFRLSYCRCEQTFCSGPSTARRHWQTRLWRGSDDPPIGSSWCSNFILRKKKKMSPAGSSGCLRHPFEILANLLKSWTEAAAWTRSCSHYRNMSWDNNPDLFGLKIYFVLRIWFRSHLVSGWPEMWGFCSKTYSRRPFPFSKLLLSAFISRHLHVVLHTCA